MILNLIVGLLIIGMFLSLFDAILVDMSTSKTIATKPSLTKRKNSIR